MRLTLKKIHRIRLIYTELSDSLINTFNAYHNSSNPLGITKVDILISFDRYFLASIFSNAAKFDTLTYDNFVQISGICRFHDEFKSIKSKRLFDAESVIAQSNSIVSDVPRFFIFAKYIDKLIEKSHLRVDPTICYTLYSGYLNIFNELFGSSREIHYEETVELLKDYMYQSN